MRSSLASLVAVIGLSASMATSTACGSSSSPASASTDSGAVDVLVTDVAAEAPSEGGGACLSPIHPNLGIAFTDRGTVDGFLVGKTYAYLGIPYAAPPVGPLRWKPPAPAECWGARAARAFGNKCVQQDAGGNIVGNEDCLTLNVWAPQDAKFDSKLPVLFFVHGGANVEGSADFTVTDGVTRLYDGQKLSERAHAIVVTFNYRLGAFGFLAHPALDAESGTKSSGNYGILDQVAALSFVARNVAGFGGDPARVMLFGESAGALDGAILFASPYAKGLFAEVLLESGYYTVDTHTTQSDLGQKLASAASCTSGGVLTCLRALSAEAIAKAIPQKFSLSEKNPNLFAPNVDGEVVPDQPLATIAAGKHNAAPFVVGSNAQELAVGIPEMTEAEYHDKVVALAGSPSSADFVLAQYPSSDWGSPRNAYVAILTDAVFTCSTRKLARAAKKGQTQPVHRYFFTHALQNAGALGKSSGAFHGLDLAFVFRHLEGNGYVPTGGELKLSDFMSDAWATFATTGKLDWPPYDATDPYQQLEDPTATASGVRTKQCDFWDAIGK